MQLLIISKSWNDSCSHFRLQGI